MKAVLLFKNRRLFKTKTGNTVVIDMDLFELSKIEPSQKPWTNYRFSWIAFNQEDPKVRVLFDSHYPKEPHFHINNDQNGQPFVWSSLKNAIKFFHAKVELHFGELMEQLVNED